MKFFMQKPAPLWWTANIRTVIYFLRELTGVFISFYALSFLVLAFFDPELAFIDSVFFRVTSWIGLTAAAFHTITWFAVTVTISPIPLPRAAQIFAFLSLLTGTIGASYFILNFFYVQ